MQSVKRWISVLVALAVLGVASPAMADRYDADRAGHPLRVIAYLAHPLGVAVDYLFLRPIHWIGEHEPFATVFGHDTGR